MTGQGAEAACLVRLTFAGSTTIEDTADEGIVLFLRLTGRQLPGQSRHRRHAGNVLAE